MIKTGKLYLIPTIISEGSVDEVIPPHVIKGMANIHHFLVEDIRTARRYLSRLKIFERIDTLQFQQLDKTTKGEELPSLIAPLFQGFDIGILSESGCPGIADPGSLAVAYAHTKNIQVIPWVGPSSILLALMASGLNGQQFAFHGYLPVQADEAGRAIRALEIESRKKNQTQLFIETPYRNNAVFSHLTKNLKDNTLLSLAQDITGPNESIRTKPIGEWKKLRPLLTKTPSIFSFLAR